MEERPVRGLGGRIALWVFYAFCFYFIWAMLRYFWIVSGVDPAPGNGVSGDMGTLSGKLLSALLGFMVLGTVGALLGAIAWYTRPRSR
ncbi:hypothetical protein GIX45_11815 [Erwinia sp. CPCC 100877]|nr:hypothetical protein [Erwinia sp. CPCC 100877]